MSRFQEQSPYNSSAPPYGGEAPKYNPGMSQPYAPSGPPAPYGGEGGFGSGLDKSPYDGDRFKLKKRFNDPIFLILFIAQVSGSYFILLMHLTYFRDYASFGKSLRDTVLSLG